MIPLGCTYDWTPPTCPGNFLVHNITGTSLDVSWSPSGDPENDIAYYQVYRNNAPPPLPPPPGNPMDGGKTSSTKYHDINLDLNTTYNYMVQPVNAAQPQNYACTSSIYVKTNATLTLKLDKNSPDARLNWTDISIGNYNIFRGTSPQVMQKIGETGGQQFDDANVLLDNVNYFYTVDDPGW